MQQFFRDYLLICKCKRCRDPTELGSYMSALKCPKCDVEAVHQQHKQPSATSFVAGAVIEEQSKGLAGGCIMPKNPLDFNSTWSCPVHCQIEVSQ